MNENSVNYGAYYWCAKVSRDLSPDGEIYCHADQFQVGAGGEAIFSHINAAKEAVQPTLVLPAGQWLAVFAASCIDGHAVCAAIWEEEIA